MRQKGSGVTAIWAKRGNIAWHELGEPWQREEFDMEKRASEEMGERRQGRKARVRKREQRE